jgi:hypothetical protein
VDGATVEGVIRRPEVLLERRRRPLVARRVEHEIVVPDHLEERDAHPPDRALVLRHEGEIVEHQVAAPHAEHRDAARDIHCRPHVRDSLLMEAADLESVLGLRVRQHQEAVGGVAAGERLQREHGAHLASPIGPQRLEECRRSRRAGRDAVTRGQRDGHPWLRPVRDQGVRAAAIGDRDRDAVGHRDAGQASVTGEDAAPHAHGRRAASARRERPIGVGQEAGKGERRGGHCALPHEGPPLH